MAHEYRATIDWARDGAAFTDNRYSRAHRWLFDGGIEVPGSSDPKSILPPLSREDAVDPEEALVAAVSSCHMLFFLAFAAKKGFVVESYRDEAVGTMSRNERGKLFISAIALDPEIVFAGDKRPSPDEIAHMHHRSHEECYLSNSVRAEVTIAGLEVAAQEPA